jgi:hypothetical protein
LPPKPKGKTSPPTPPKKQRTSAGVGDHLEQQ